MTNEQTPQPQVTITDERLQEIEERANRATPGPWMTKPSGANHGGFSLDALIAATAAGKFNRIYATPPGGTYPAADQDFIAAARQDVPDLLAEIRQLRAKVAEQESELAAARRNGDRTHRQLMDALAHPEDYTKMRARLLAREAVIGHNPWRGMLNIGDVPAGNVRSITHPTTPRHPDFDGLNGNLRGGTFKTQDEYATARGPAGYIITTSATLPTDTVLMINHPVQARPELICARCGGWHPYMQQVIAIKDGVVGQAEWVGCTSPQAPTDSNQGEGA